MWRSLTDYRVQLIQVRLPLALPHVAWTFCSWFPSSLLPKEEVQSSLLGDPGLSCYAAILCDSLSTEGQRWEGRGTSAPRSSSFQTLNHSWTQPWEGRGPCKCEVCSNLHTSILPRKQEPLYVPFQGPMLFHLTCHLPLPSGKDTQDWKKKTHSGQTCFLVKIKRKP